MLLTDLLGRLSGAFYHWLLGLLGVDVETFHEWLEGFCTCGVFDDSNEEEDVLVS
jgi:hypothetical protein